MRFTRPEFWPLLITFIILMSSSPAVGEPTNLHGTVRVNAADLAQHSVRHFRGEVVKEGGKWRLSYALIGSQNPAEPKPDTVEVDKINRRATFFEANANQARMLDFGQLEQTRWSEIPSRPEALGTFLLLGDQVKQKARFLRNTTFNGHPVQEYSFVEDKDFFGRLFVSVEYGIPLKLDVFGPNGVHSLVVVENVQLQ